MRSAGAYSCPAVGNEIVAMRPKKNLEESTNRVDYIKNSSQVLAPLYW